MTNTDINLITGEIVDACFQVHRELGLGLIESVYEYALLKEMELRNIHARNQERIRLFYKGFDTGKYFRIDMLVIDEILIELKSCEALLPVHSAQVISYLKISNKKIGLLINFNVPLIKDGIKRFVNGGRQ